MTTTCLRTVVGGKKGDRQNLFIAVNKTVTKLRGIRSPSVVGDNTGFNILVSLIMQFNELIFNFYVSLSVIIFVMLVLRIFFSAVTF